MFGIEFFPTPQSLTFQMCQKVDFKKVTSILEPSAGKGDVIEGIKKYNELVGHRKNYEYMAIEIDPNLQSVLQGLDDINVIDSDFLQYEISDHFDLIMMNPPFSNGDLHLLKAIDVMFDGQIVCLLNAQTLKNPCTNTRQLLVRRLKELNADIEYIENAFIDAERKTGVEIALIYIKKYREVDQNIFAGTSDSEKEEKIEDLENNEVVIHSDIEQRIARYNVAKKAGFDLIQSYHNISAKCHNLIEIKVEGDYETRGAIKRNQTRYTNYVRVLRRKYWLELMDSPKIANKLTEKKRCEYREMLKKRTSMEFNFRNIQAVFVNLQEAYYQSIEDAIIDMFETMSHEHSWYSETSKNKLHFNGWKTNKAWKVNNKVILPSFSFFAWGSWRLNYSSKDRLNDIDRVMSYFDGGNNNYLSIMDAIDQAFKKGQSRNILSTYFEITCYKKGTLHLKFRDEGVLRRFNVFSAKNKSWLPPSYGEKSVSEMTPEEKEIIKEFDGSLDNYALLPSNQVILRLAA